MKVESGNFVNNRERVVWNGGIIFVQEKMSNWKTSHKRNRLKNNVDMKGSILQKRKL